jgi:hypothetical protein
MSEILGCKRNENALACVREKDWKNGLDASAQVSSPSSLQLPFYPRVDDKVVFDVATYNAKGKFGDIVQVVRFNLNTGS